MNKIYISTRHKMASEKRQMDDFTKFPGEIKDNVYKFPILLSTDSHGKIRQWVIQVRLIKEKSRKSKYDIDWNVISEDVIPILDKYLVSTDIPKGTISQVYTETGQRGGKTTRQPPSFPEAKNIGKKNFRNELKSALVDARSKYLAKIKAGFVTEADFGDGKSKKDSPFFYPMLLHDFRKLEEKLDFPCYGQRKYDGDRAISYYDSANDKVVIYSRNLLEYPGMQYIKKQLKKIFRQLPDGIYLDGEFYEHGVKLQTINGAVRLTTDDEAKKLKLKYCIFDTFMKEKKSKFSSRFIKIKEKLGAEDSKDFAIGDIIFVETKLLKNRDKLETYFAKSIAKGYEGIILRNIDAPYLTSNLKNSATLRSRDVLKYKKKMSAEYPVVGYTSGTNGKEENAVLWIVELPNGKKLTLQPKNITYAEREKILKECKKNFDSMYNRRMLTVVFDELSKDGTPLRAKAVGFRATE